MAKKTVINRAAKFFINISDDSDILADSINKTTADEYDNDRQLKDVTPAEKEETLDDILKQPKSEKATVFKTEIVGEEAVNQELTTTDASYPDDKAPAFVDPETGEIKASEGNLFDNLEDL